MTPPSSGPQAAQRSSFDAATAGRLLLVAGIWGLNFSVSKWTLREIPVLAFSALRFLLASILLAALLYRRERTLRPPPGSLGQLLALGIVGNSIYQLCFLYGLQLSTAGNSALVLAAMPAMVAALGAGLGIERLSRRGLQGLTLASLGVIAVVAARGVSVDAETLRGDGLTFAAVICWASFTLGVRQLSLPMSGLAITAWTMILGTPALVALGMPSLLRLDWGSVSAAGWAGLGYASALSLVLAYVLWNDSIRKIGSSRTAVFACVTPLVALGAATVVLGERPTPVQLIGAAAILGGVILSQSASPQRAGGR